MRRRYVMVKKWVHYSTFHE